MPERVLNSHKSLTALLIFALVALSYFNASGNGFVYDDTSLVQSNPLIWSWRSLPEIFTTGYWTVTFGASGGLYRPLTTASFVLDYAVNQTPLSFHLDNIFIHFLCSLLVFSILKALTGREKPAFFAAAVFAVHPVHTEAVAWVSGRAELLSVLLLLLSFWVFLKRPYRPRYVIASAALFFLALLAKETAVVLPLLIAVYMLLYQPQPTARENVLRILSRLWPYAAAFAAYFLIRALVLADGMLPPAHTIPLNDVGPYERLLTMLTAFFHYIRLGFIPTELTVFYYFFTKTPFDFTVIGFLAAVVLLAVFSRRLVAASRDASFGVSLFFIGLLPVSNIILTGIIMSERAMYLPSVGVCLILGLAFERATTAGHIAARRIAFGVFALLIVSFIALALTRNPFWRSEDEFMKANMAHFERAIKVNPDVSSHHSRLADLRIYQGMYDAETLGHIDEALRLNPNDFEAHLGKAVFYEHQGRLEEALSEYEACVEISPRFKAYNGAGVVLYKLGRTEESEKALEEAAGLNPYCGICYLNLGVTRLTLGNPDGAYRDFEAAARLNPYSFEAHFRMGVLLGARGEAGKAVEALKKASGLAPDNAEAHYYLAAAYAGDGDANAALTEIYRALEIKPGYPDAMELKGRLGY